MGRGSLSGSNAHGLWKVCSRCKLRILYVPAFGAHAHYRQAGPLPSDVATTVEKVKEKETKGETIPPKTLAAKTVALEGAEQSMLRRLEQIRTQKEKSLGMTTMPKGRGKGKSPSAPMPTTMNYEHTNSEEMAKTPGRKKAREQDSEQLEFESRETPDSWTRVEEPTA